MKNAFSALLIALFLAACGSTPPKDDKSGAAVESREPTKVAPPPAPTTKPQVTQPEVKPSVTKPVAVNPLKDPNNILSKRSVYYEFDSSVVKDEYKPVVSAHAKFLTENRARKITVQGNTDEKGSREYNLALGQRRADSVKRMMMVLGVSEGQVESVSFGEEKPRATGSDEASMAENRRSDIIYDGEQ